MLLRSRELVRVVASRPPKLMLADAARVLRPGLDGMAAIMPTRSKASRIILAAALGTTAVTAGTFAVPGQTSKSATMAPTAQLDLTAEETMTTGDTGPGAAATSAATRQTATVRGGQTAGARTPAQRTTAARQGTAAAAPGTGTAAAGRPAARGRVTVRGGQPGGTLASGNKTYRARPKPRRVVTAGEVVKLARAQIGIRENKAGGGTKFHSWYVSSRRAAQTAKRDGGKPADYRNAAWCDMFVSWVGERTGTSASVGADAFTVEHAKWFQRRKRWGHQPKLGSVAFFDWNKKNSRDADTIDHVALVVNKNRNGSIKTVEGNISDKVVIKNRPVSSVVGFGYPDFAR